MSYEPNVKQAIEQTIELWTWLEKTGEPKFKWPEWKINGGKYPRTNSSCFLCEYDTDTLIREGKSPVLHKCGCCPYKKKFDYCSRMRNGIPISPYSKWEDAETEATRREYAGKCLEQLNELLKEATECQQQNQV